MHNYQIDKSTDTHWR